MEYTFRLGTETQTVRIERDKDSFVVRIGDQTCRIKLDSTQSGEIAFSIGDRHRRAYIASDGQQRWVAFDANVLSITKVESGEKRAIRQRPGTDSLNATMPGQVVKLLASEGEIVKRGQALIVLEAMKMELRLTAPHDGKVTRVLVRQGEIVERGQRLLEVAAE